ncbi:MAG TPA: ADOP family duplicated permease [Rudaea sp.]|nr:ADOP family duplicated permease [Rudaea sp.]
MTVLLQELRHGARAILARPAFSALVVGVLAAGLACVVFMLALLDGFVLRPLPFAAPERLYQAGFLGDGDLGDLFPVSDQDLIAIRRRLAGSADVAGAARSTINLSDLDRPERYNGAHVSANLFRVLGVAPILGRDFVDADEQPGAPPVAMLSYDLWQNRYGGDRGVVGRVIRVDARPATVIGVMPRDFSYPRSEQIWVATTLAEAATRDEYGYWVVLRRHADVTAAAIGSAIAGWFDDAARNDPERLRGQRAGVEPLATMVMDRTTRSLLGMMLAAVFMVLLIACANATNLLLTRTLGRRSELAVRVALGASRTRLIADLLGQSLLLSLLATAVALPLAQVGLRWQQALLRESDFTLAWLHFDVDGTVALLALAAALLTAFCSGVLPALHAGNAAPSLGLQDANARSVGSAGFARISRVIVIGEVALSCALVVCVGTLARGIAALEHADLGIDTNHLLTARILLPTRAYPTGADQVRLYERIGARLREDAGVVDASLGTALPGTYYNEQHDVLPAGAAPGDAELPQTRYAAVDDHFPGAWGVSLQAGRFFDARDSSDGARVAVVDRRFVERYGDGKPVLGRQFRLDPRDPQGRTVTVIGVIGAVALDAPGNAPLPTLLVPLRQSPFNRASIAVRTRGDALAFAPHLGEVMRAVDADTPLYWVRDYAAILKSMSFGERTVVRSFAAFGAVALLLAGAGLYGVMAFAVAQRTREIGVRRALGASPWSVLRNLFARNFAQLAIGLAIGLAAGMLFSRQLSASLRTIEPGGATVVLGALLVLAGAAALAVIVPARRALRVDPMTALRHE